MGCVTMRGAAGAEGASAARGGAYGRVLSAEPYFRRLPNRALPQLWAFHNPGNLTITYTRGGNRGQVVSNYLSANDADVDNAPDGFASGGANVVVGGIDTGVDFSHAEFSGGRLIAGRDWYSNDTDPSDTDGHGTHTAGTMAGSNVGVAGVAGAASQVKVYVQRVCGGQGCPTSAIVSAIYAAADYPGMVAMNLSLGGGSESQAEKDAISYAVGKDVLVIASAGNGGTNTVSCPACDPNAISIGALNWQDGLTYYTNTGSGLDLTAPGGEMYSNTTDESGIYSSVPGGYAYYQGTSMAAPVVTGIAAIVASKTGLRGSALRTRLEGTVDDLGAPGTDTNFGKGRVNAYRAVTNTNPGGGGGGPTPVDASFTTRCSNDSCTFDASASTGTNLTYAWAFQGGATASGVTASQTYNSAGNYTVTLAVTDGTATDSASDTVTCQVRGKNLKCS
jgi:serine protease